MMTRAFEYENKLREASKDALSLMNHGDVFASVSHSQSVSFEYGKLQAVDDVSHSALGCRIFENGQVGNAFVNDPLQYQKMISDAKESSLFGDKISFELPTKTSYKSLDWLYCDKNMSYSKQDLKDLGADLLQKIQKFAPKSKVSVDVHQSFSLSMLRNTNAFEGEYQESALTIYGGLFELGVDDSFIELYEGQTFYTNQLSFDKILKSLEERLTRSQKNSSFSYTGEIPVIFAPSALDSILDPIEIAANGKTLYKDLSLFKGRIAEKMFDQKFQFVDDPFYQFGSASVPFDDEGTIPQVRNIIKDGVFEQFIYDCASASKMNTTSTGHANRSTASLPSPAFSNRLIGAGQHALEEMIGSIEFGLLLESSLGEGQSNVIAGDFSILADSAFLIKNGKLEGRVKDVMLSGNAFELLKNIPMIENQIHHRSSLFAPHIMLDKVNATTK
ncbi:MAG: TldD/PmbA family protein [Brevinema sp.]